MTRVKTIKNIIRKRKNTSLVSLIGNRKVNTARLGNTLLNMEAYGTISLFVGPTDVIIQNNAKV